MTKNGKEEVNLGACLPRHPGSAIRVWSREIGVRLIGYGRSRGVADRLGTRIGFARRVGVGIAVFAARSGRHVAFAVSGGESAVSGPSFTLEGCDARVLEIID